MLSDRLLRERLLNERDSVPGLAMLAVQRSVEAARWLADPKRWRAHNSFASDSRSHDVTWLLMCSVEAVENIGAHYVPTLLKWRETFNEKQE
jgi:hypothetical protein